LSQDHEPSTHSPDEPIGGEETRRPSTPGMTENDAAAALGVWPGANAEEILHRFEQLCAALDARASAATPSLDEKAYRRERSVLRAACDRLLSRSPTEPSAAGPA
jgi:hypothetical protein